jgi:hypothetical protein
VRALVAGLLLLGTIVIGQPVAADDTRTFLDQCADVTTPTTQRDLVAPWIDLCSGAVAVTAAPTAAIDIELQLAGDVTQRTDSHYQVHWTVAGCQSSVVWADGLGGVRFGPLVAARITGGWLDLVCGETEQRFTLPAELLTFDANTVRWSIPLEGDLAALAGLYQAGTVLTELRADAGPDVVLMGRSGGEGICLDGDCWSYLADAASGRDVVVD